jgi:hypothetical protein
MTFWFEAPGYVVQEKSFLSREPVAGSIYMVLICLIIVLGTAGNILILGAVYVSKVSLITFSLSPLAFCLLLTSVSLLPFLFCQLSHFFSFLFFNHQPNLPTLSYKSLSLLLARLHLIPLIFPVAGS